MSRAGGADTIGTIEKEKAPQAKFLVMAAVFIEAETDSQARQKMYELVPAANVLVWKEGVHAAALTARRDKEGKFIVRGESQA